MRIRMLLSLFQRSFSAIRSAIIVTAVDPSRPASTPWPQMDRGVYSHRYLGHWVAWLTFSIDSSPISLQNDVLASGWIEKSHHVPEVIEIRDFFPPNHKRAFFNFLILTRRISIPRTTACPGLAPGPHLHALYFCRWLLEIKSTLHALMSSSLSWSGYC